MENTEFFDLLYQQWSKTTEASNGYWMPEEDESFPGMFNIRAVVQDGKKKQFVTAFTNEADAEFITAMHGCLPDLIRQLREAEDEAGRLDFEVDILHGRIAALELELQQIEDR